MAFIPSVDLGITVQTNTDVTNDVLEGLVKLIMEDTLGLGIDSLKLSVSGDDVPFGGLQADPKPPTLPMDEYIGTYTDLGYGNITLCSSTSTSPDCLRVLQDFATVDSPITKPDTLYAAHSSVMSTHLRLRHVSEENFRLSYTYLFKDGYGKDTRPFEWLEPGRDSLAQFVLSEDGSTVIGFGVLGARAKAADWKERGMRVQDVAEVWFAKA